MTTSLPEKYLRVRNLTFSSTIAVLVALSVSICVPSSAQAKPKKEIAQNAFPSVVTLIMANADGQSLSQGSGFFVRSNVVATNLHVIEKAHAGHAKIVNQKAKYEIEEVLAVDTRHDLALLMINGAHITPLTLGDSNQAAVGDEVYAVGSPKGLEGTFSQGILSGIRTDESLFQITAPISPSSSAGPVLNSQGRVIGVATAILEGGQNLNFAIPSSFLELLLASRETTSSPPEEHDPLQSIRKRYEDFSVRQEINKRFDEFKTKKAREGPKLAVQMINEMLRDRTLSPERQHALRQEKLGWLIATDQALAFVPAGEFYMGLRDTEGESNEHPRHLIHLDAFFMDRHEVTGFDYDKFLQATGLKDKRSLMLSVGLFDEPVRGIDWYYADAYCKWAGKRLPTEAEWEKAARGSDERKYPWGNEAPNAALAKLKPAGKDETGKSPYGIYDMAGNVWEWVADWYDETYYQKSPARNPKGTPDGKEKVLRGGSWEHDPDNARSTFRRSEPPTVRYDTIGFRCAMDAR